MTITKNYTIPETASVLGVASATIRKEVKRGTITTVVVGRRIFIPETAISAYLSSRTRPAQVAA
jgi:excisionase family DNA binding protein